MVYQTGIDFARQMDARDPLRDFRKLFRIPVSDGREKVYFLGNSLGLQPQLAGAAVDLVLEEWAQYGVEGFFMGSRPWLQFHERLTPALSMLTGAGEHELSVMNQLTVNLHLMLASFYRPAGKRFRILCEARAFPSDQYMLETHVRKMGFDPATAIVEVSPPPGQACIREEDILQRMNDLSGELALVLWGGVNYYTGQVFDMASLCREANRLNIPIGFDLAHAVGNIPLNLHNWGADFACWCSYKYLNSGPGAVGGVFVHEKHHGNREIPRLAGWWGTDPETRFLMEKGFVPASSAAGWQLSTPSIILYALHEAALNIFEKAGIDALHEKRRQMTAYARFLLQQEEGLANSPSIRLLTPAEPEQQGCQFSFYIEKNGRKYFDALTDAGFMVDWREPGVVRLAPVPLYNRYEEIFQFIEFMGSLSRQQG